MLESLYSDNLPAPRFRYSPMIKAGPFYKTAGMVALDHATGELVVGGVHKETEKILNNLTAALPDFDLTLNDLVSATIFTTEFSSFKTINEAWEKVFNDDIRPPTRTAVGVVALPLEAKVEIEFMFYKD